MKMARFTNAEYATRYIRAHQPMTMPELTAALGWHRSQTNAAVLTARRQNMLKIVGKRRLKPFGPFMFVIAAVQTNDWPQS